MGAAARGRGFIVVAVAAVLALCASTVAGASVVRDATGTAALATGCGVDEFDGTALDDERWDVLRPTTGGATVADGKLSLELLQGDLINDNATASNVVLQDAPARRLDGDDEVQHREHRHVRRAGRHRAVALRGPAADEQHLREGHVHPDGRRRDAGDRVDLDRPRQPGGADLQQPGARADPARERRRADAHPLRRQPRHRRVLHGRRRNVDAGRADSPLSGPAPRRPRGHPRRHRRRNGPVRALRTRVRTADRRGAGDRHRAARGRPHEHRRARRRRLDVGLRRRPDARRAGTRRRTRSASPASTAFARRRPSPAAPASSPARRS